MQKKNGILVSVVGTTPQVVTETLYGLAVCNKEPVDEIYIITTSEGLKVLKSVNFDEKIRRFNELYKTNVRFTYAENVYVINSSNKEEILDIRDSKDSEDTANFIFNAVKEIQRINVEKRLFTSIAGGRKTMTAYMALIMTLLGGKEDKLYHVMVPPYIETERNFFFPEPGGRLLLKDGREVPHDNIKIDLVEISYVRLKNKFGDRINLGTTYKNIVSKFQEEVDTSKQTYQIYKPDDKVILIKDTDEIEKLSFDATSKTAFLAGVSRSFQKTTADLEAFARNDCEIVLLYGETGTGKELFARYYANLLGKGMMVINIGGSSKDLIASELFGHKKGSFTGADTDRVGMIKTAVDQGSILFFDEVEKMPYEVSSQLNRFVQFKQVRRVGDDYPENIEGKIYMIFALNEDPEKLIQEEKLPEDFFNRISRYRVNIDNLNSRIEDIELIVRLILKKKSIERGTEYRTDDEALKILNMCNWKNKNVRVLENVILNSAIRSKDGVIKKDILLSVLEENKIRKREDIVEDYTANKDEDAEIKVIENLGYDKYLEEYEKKILSKLTSKYKKQKVLAEKIKIPESTLSIKLKKLGLKK